jgi:hypothetical protein
MAPHHATACLLQMPIGSDDPSPGPAFTPSEYEFIRAFKAAKSHGIQYQDRVGYYTRIW